MNVHNGLAAIGYGLENGPIMQLLGRRHYIACKYDEATRKELLETSNQAQSLDLAGMAAIRAELLPTCLARFYPADIGNTWYIAFFNITARKIDSYTYPVAGRNVSVVLEKFLKNGLGESLEGAFWYSKKSSGFFSRNPYDTGQAGIPSLLAFLQDEQLGYVPDMQPQEGYAPYGQDFGGLATTTRAQSPPSADSINSMWQMGRFSDLERQIGTNGKDAYPQFLQSSPVTEWRGFTLRIKPDPPLPDTPPAPKSVVKPNKLGRLIDLEEEP